MQSVVFLSFFIPAISLPSAPHSRQCYGRLGTQQQNPWLCRVQCRERFRVYTKLAQVRDIQDLTRLQMEFIQAQMQAMTEQANANVGRSPTLPKRISSIGYRGRMGDVALTCCTAHYFGAIPSNQSNSTQDKGAIVSVTPFCGGSMPRSLQAARCWL
jgi:hypothetical protein